MDRFLQIRCTQPNPLRTEWSRLSATSAQRAGVAKRVSAPRAFTGYVNCGMVRAVEHEGPVGSGRMNRNLGGPLKLSLNT
jgi:hypothetical protein